MIPAKYEMPVRALPHLRSQPVLGTNRIAEVYHKTAVRISDVERGVGGGSRDVPAPIACGYWWARLPADGWGIAGR